MSRKIKTIGKAAGTFALVLLMLLQTACVIRTKPLEDLEGMRDFNYPKGAVNSLEYRGLGPKPRARRSLFLEPDASGNDAGNPRLKDSYVFEQDFSGSLQYPFLLSFADLTKERFRPELYHNDEKLSFELKAGFAIQEQLSSTRQKSGLEKMLLKELNAPSYYEAAAEAVPEIKTEAHVLMFRDLKKSEEDRDRSLDLKVSFQADEAYFCYGFNGLEFAETGKVTLSSTFGNPGDLTENEACLIFLGSEPELTVQVWDMAEDRSIPGYSLAASRLEESFDALLSAFGQRYLKSIAPSADEALSDLFCSQFLKEKKNLLSSAGEAYEPMLEEVFSDLYHADRFFYMEISEPLTEDSRLDIVRTVPGSYNFGGLKDTSYKGLHFLSCTDFSIAFPDNNVFPGTLKLRDAVAIDMNEPSKTMRYDAEKESFSIPPYECFTLTYFVREP